VRSLPVPIEQAGFEMPHSSRWESGRTSLPLEIHSSSYPASTKWRSPLNQFFVLPLVIPPQLWFETRPVRVRSNGAKLSTADMVLTPPQKEFFNLIVAGTSSGAPAIERCQVLPP
jgi:hypothetical protein